jgi:hypothetical protein
MKVDFKNITTAAHVETYEASHGVFEALLQEVKELSRKKPEATMSAGKVKIVNWPAAGSADTELGVLMGPEVGHGETKVYAGVQA